MGARAHGFYRFVQVEKVLGKGTYGTVFRVCRLSDGQKYAMKQVDIKKMSPKERSVLAVLIQAKI